MYGFPSTVDAKLNESIVEVAEKHPDAGKHGPMLLPASELLMENDGAPVAVNCHAKISARATALAPSVVIEPVRELPPAEYDKS